MAVVFGSRSSARLKSIGIIKSTLKSKKVSLSKIEVVDLSSASDVFESVALAEALMLEEAYFGSCVKDHTPLMLVAKVVTGGPKPFHLEIGWLEKKEVVDLICHSWENTVSVGSVDFQLHKKLLEIKKKLIGWKKESRYVVKTKIDEVLLDIKMLDLNIQQEGVLTEEMSMKRNSKHTFLFYLKRLEDIYWKQRSRMKGLKEGDRNTKFFHAIANARKRQNDISSITIPGVDLDDSLAMERAVVDHFKKAFNLDVSFTQKLNMVPFKCLTLRHVAQLEVEVIVEELKRAIFDLLGDKAPSPNGFPLVFFLEVLEFDLLELA
ncbi:uncharacterized protein LOC105420067 [Amborella trichopoda]|uniref:uncharacterized protein LOC105420067 n=1 Tax=Amborella trichopoda TaxID=13333 RepID=UPI0005D4351D|nr:uncharacterized protein LOC105420067 [Amborella trichopoda]|eukprot:XP_011620520.1 uncharacterized protein LOC105420067 [Amborella trichopoda]